jgi:tripartite-type tricarboxylate transporter receptor subunit TctC
MELFNMRTGARMTHVPYRGSAPMLTELMAGRVDLGVDNLPSSLNHIREGRLKGLAVTSERRSSALPDVPTTRELGFAFLEADGWNGLFVPAKTPREVIERLQKEVASAVKHPETARRLREVGAEPVGSSPAEQDAILKRQVEQFKPIIKEMKIES